MCVCGQGLLYVGISAVAVVFPNDARVSATVLFTAVPVNTVQH